MRKRLLGTIAAITTGAGAALAQGPGVPPPAPIGMVGGMNGPVYPAAGMMTPDPIPPQFGGGPMGDPTGGLGALTDPSGGFGGPGMPGYPAGMHGQPSWSPPTSKIPSRDRFWFDGNYQLLFARAQPVRFPLITTSAPADGARLGRPTTSILHSTTDLGYGLFSGFKLETGLFCDDCRRSGFYAGGFFTEQKSNAYNVASDFTGQPTLGRPFFNAATGAPDVLLVSFPTFASGSVTVITNSHSYGAEIGSATNLYRSDPECGGKLWNVNLLAAFRFLEVDENLDMSSRSMLLNGFTAPFDGKLYAAPATIEVRDIIETRNQFYGGQVGLATSAKSGRNLFALTGKLALGVIHQRVNIRGFSTLNDPTRGIASQVVGGLFANASNIGQFNNDEFGVIPEVTATWAYHWTSWLSTSVGYNFLYVNRVARPGNQFTPAVNPGLVPTSPSYGFGGAIATPNVLFTQGEYWLQGVNFGFQVRF